MAAALYILFFAAFYFSAAHGGHSTDTTSLLAFKSSVAFDESKNLISTWKIGMDCCLWHGVSCDSSSGRVVVLNLTGDSKAGGCQLTGIISPAIANLTDLRVLALPHNALSGVIPRELGNIVFLEILELQGNNLSGNIPEEISSLGSLLFLNLSFNFFSGAIPGKLLGYGRIEVLDLSSNQLNGKLELDEDAECDHLKHMKLGDNFLTAGLPSELGKCRQLRTLSVAGNIFEGRIPREIGRLTELRVLDVSRNSLTDRIPKEITYCRNLVVLVLTDLLNLNSGKECGLDSCGGEFNAFDGNFPPDLFLLPNLQILWSPRANLAGRLSETAWAHSCSLRMLNLGQNYLHGNFPEIMAALCKDLIFLDLSSNALIGSLPSQLSINCMTYLNVSRNFFTGVLPAFNSRTCTVAGEEEEDTHRRFHVNRTVIVHDFSRNRFVGSPPQLNLAIRNRSASSYSLSLNNNLFNGSIPPELVSHCNDLHSFSVNLSSNFFSGELEPPNCSKLKEFEAANNRITGFIVGPSGSLRFQLKHLERILLGGNNFTGEIPEILGELTSLIVLDLSRNDLTGEIPATLAKNNRLQVMLLDHNRLRGGIPQSLSSLKNLSRLDVSFNNLAGTLPEFRHPITCDSFAGNPNLLFACADQYASPVVNPTPRNSKSRRLKPWMLTAVTLSSFTFSVLVSIILAAVHWRRKLQRRRRELDRRQKSKSLVTFSPAPPELNYGNVVRTTENFSVKYLIGTGGFGSTYRAELLPGFLVAVKRLSIGKFQGVQQFDAEIRTLGRIRHRNLVTLIGSYMNDSEMLLIYNYLSGGNLETFIHQNPNQNLRWPVVRRIAIDVAQALVYLHCSCDPRIVHRDIKPSNILLDGEQNAYLSDFGLARLLEVSETHATTDVAGTFGYVAPEYAMTCRVSEKADVYSFGVVLLEMASGKKSLDPSFSDYGNGFNIVAWAKLMIDENRSPELFSPGLWETGPKDSLAGLLRLASFCTMESLSLRPSMRQVLEKLRQLN